MNRITKHILPFLEKYSNVLIAISALLTTIATFFIWGVSRKQTEISRQQMEYAHLIGKASVQPIITVGYFVETMHDVTVRHDFGSIAGKGEKIRVILVTNIGKGEARNLKIEHRGRKEIEEIDILPVGHTHEYSLLEQSVKSGGISPVVKVTYQDVFENEFTIKSLPPHRTITETTQLFQD